MKSEPVIVFYKTSTCPHCNNLNKIWDQVTKEIKKISPNIRFFILNSTQNNGSFDNKLAPTSLIKFNAWFPMILLVPGNVWDAAMKNLGENNEVDIKDGVIILNGKFNDNKLSYVHKYDIRKPDQIAQWVKESLNDDSFKTIQNSNIPIIPIKKAIQPSTFQPFLSSLSKKSDTKYLESGPDNICSMKIISRPN